MASERELCKVCGGNGVVKIPGGVSVCNHCEGVCWEPAPVPPSPAEAHTRIASLREALDWLTHLACGVGKAGGEPEQGEFEAAMECAKAALAASAPEKGEKP